MVDRGQSGRRASQHAAATTTSPNQPTGASSHQATPRIPTTNGLCDQTQSRAAVLCAAANMRIAASTKPSAIAWRPEAKAGRGGKVKRSSDDGPSAMKWKDQSALLSTNSSRAGGGSFSSKTPD